MEISLLDILEATGGHLNCNSPITERFYAQYGRAAQKARNSKPDNQDIPEGDYTDRFITGTKKLRSRKYIPMLMLLALLSCAGKAGAQTVAVKSDLLTGGMLASPNLGVELKLSERFTLEARVYYKPLSGRRRQTLETLVRAAGAALLDVPALRRTFLRDRPDVRRVQRSQGKAAFRAVQRGTFRKIRGRLYGSGNIIRLSLHPLPPAGDWRQASA